MISGDATGRRCATGGPSGSTASASTTSPTHPLLRKSVDWVASHLRRGPWARRTRCTGCRRTEDELREQIEVLLSSDRTAATTAGCMALGNRRRRARGRRPRVRPAPRTSRRAVATRTSGSPPRSTTPPSRSQVVERRNDGMVISGGKQHVVGAAVVHELLVVPSGRSGEADAAVACAVPVNSDGRAADRVTPPRPAPRTTGTIQSAGARASRRRSSCSTTCSCRPSACSSPARRAGRHIRRDPEHLGTRPGRRRPSRPGRADPRPRADDLGDERHPRRHPRARQARRRSPCGRRCAAPAGKPRWPTPG